MTVGRLEGMNDAIDEFPGLKARTLRFTCGAPRSARAIGDGSRALFLRSDGPEDTVTSLWMSVIGSDGDTDEILLADRVRCWLTPTPRMCRLRKGAPRTCA